MRKEEKKYLQEVLENSEIGLSREGLRKLAEDILSYKLFKKFLQQKFTTDYFDSSDVISKIIYLWVLLMGKEANLNNFEQILRRQQLYAIAGK